MIKRMIALVFLLAFAMQTFSRAFIVFDYFVNTKSFAKKCENKARPKMHCNGKCQMMKKLKQEEKKDEQLPERKGENKNEILSTKSFFASLPGNPSRETTMTYGIDPCGKETKMPRFFFHPPGA